MTSVTRAAGKTRPGHKKEPQAVYTCSGFRIRSCCFNLGFFGWAAGVGGMGCRPARPGESGI